MINILLWYQQIVEMSKKHRKKQKKKWTVNDVFCKEHNSKSKQKQRKRAKGKSLNNFKYVWFKQKKLFLE